MLILTKDVGIFHSIQQDHGPRGPELVWKSDAWEIKKLILPPKSEEEGLSIAGAGGDN